MAANMSHRRSLTDAQMPERLLVDLERQQVVA
jgi:hypothetical protein